MAKLRVEHGTPPYWEDNWEEYQDALNRPDLLEKVVERARKWLIAEFGPEVARENVPDELALELYLES